MLVKEQTVLESHLNQQISGSIPQFGKAFANLDQLKEDMVDTKEKTEVMQDSAKMLKKFQLQNLVRV